MPSINNKVQSTPTANAPKQALKKGLDDTVGKANVFDIDAFHASAKVQSTSSSGSHRSFFGSIGHFFGSALGAVGHFFGSIPHTLQSLLYGYDDSAFKTRKVTDDPSDVNNPTSDDIAQAQQQTRSNQAAEKAAIAKLPADQQKEYNAVLGQVQNDPMARRALQKMLLDGRLPGSKDLKGQGTVLDQLNNLTSAPLAKGIDRASLVSQVTSEVENPVRIDQQQKGTCGPTTAQILLARKNPAEYVRIINGLASPGGSVQLAGGDTVSRNSDWNDDNDGGRSISSRLFEPALMQDGETLLGFHIPFMHYNNQTDKNQEGPLGLSGGLMNGGEAHIVSQLLGKNYDSSTYYFFNRDGKWNDLKSALSAGKGPIPVSLEWNDGDGPGGHFVQIDKIQSGTVYYTNPWGQRETMSENEFKSHITGQAIPS
ncbi:MAG TPA: hypothetical protein V6D47_20590 [Oscillatoriaceae cyanobacterium]